MNTSSFFRRPGRFLILRLATIALVVLAWSSFAFGGEIHHAALMGNLEKVKALVEDNPHLVFSKDDNGDTPLHNAAITGHKAVAEFLVANKADVNAKDNIGLTPLHCAALTRQKDMAEFLLANKADVNAEDKEGNTPLHYAWVNGDKEMTKLLRQHGGHH